MRYKITARVADIRTNTTVMPEKEYGGWMAINTGSNTATVMGYTLMPGEGLDFTQAVPAGSIWDSPIEITIAAGAVVRITRLEAKEIG